jgi:hypothetical protein
VTVKDGKRDGRCCHSEVLQAKFVTYPPRISKIANIERKRQIGNWRLSPMRLRPTSKPRNMQLCAVEDRCKSLRDSARTRGPWLSSRAFRPVLAFPRPWPPRPSSPGPCPCQLHPLASQWLTAKFRTASMLAVNFFSLSYKRPVTVPPTLFISHLHQIHHPTNRGLLLL